MNRFRRRFRGGNKEINNENETDNHQVICPRLGIKFNQKLCVFGIRVGKNNRWCGHGYGNGQRKGMGRGRIG